MTDQDTPGHDDELADAASEAWLYFSPLLLMQLTRQVEADVELTTWAHSEAFRTAEFTSVVRPNLDTRYSHAWLDLSAGPVVLSAPDTDGRYHVVQAMDDWTRTFATVGARTTGDRARSIVFVSPDHEASDPDGEDPWPSDALVIPAPTDRVWLLLRIQSNGVDDGAAIADLQARFVLRAVDESRTEAAGEAPAAGWITAEIIASLGNGTPPPEILTEMNAETFFGWAADLWGGPGLPVPDEDAAFVSRAAALGLRPGEPHDWSARSGDQRAALDGAMERAIAKLLAEAARQGGRNQDGWYYLKDNWYQVDGHLVTQQQPTNYTLRAGLAIEALGYLPLQEATYVSAGVPRVGGETLTGEGGRRFTLRFPPGQLPPVNAFWSLTVYAGAGYLVENPIDRYNLSSRDQLAADDDGGVTLHLAQTNPHGPDSTDTSNWLPIPAGEFSVTFRAYWPSEPIVLGDDGWHLEPVRALA